MIRRRAIHVKISEKRSSLYISRVCRCFSRIHEFETVGKKNNKKGINKKRLIRVRIAPVLINPFLALALITPSSRVFLGTHHNLAMHFPNPTTTAARTLKPNPNAQTNNPKAQESNFNTARVVRGNFSSVGSKVSNVLVGIGRLGIFNFPLLPLTVLGLVAVAVFGDAVGTGNKPPGTDSSSSVFLFVFGLDLDFFPGTLRRERTDHGRF